MSFGLGVGRGPGVGRGRAGRRCSLRWSGRGCGRWEASPVAGFVFGFAAGEADVARIKRMHRISTEKIPAGHFSGFVFW